MCDATATDTRSMRYQDRMDDAYDRMDDAYDQGGTAAVVGAERA